MTQQSSAGPRRARPRVQKPVAWSPRWRTATCSQRVARAFGWTASTASATTLTRVEEGTTLEWFFSPTNSSLPEFMNFNLFGKTILVVNIEFELFFLFCFIHSASETHTHFKDPGSALKKLTEPTPLRRCSLVRRCCRPCGR